MRRRLVLSYVLLAVVVLVALEVPLGLVTAQRERDNVRADARRDATVLAAGAFHDLDGDHDNGPGSGLDDLAARYQAGTGSEIVVVDGSGAVAAYRGGSDESGHPDTDDVHTPLLRAALQGHSGVASASDEGTPVEVAAEPVTGPHGEVVGAVQVSVSATRARDHIRRLIVILIAFAIAVLGLVVGIGLVIARSVVNPLRRLTDAVRALETGDLAARTPVEGPPELRTLGTAFNRMADRLGELIVSQRNFLADASHQLRSPLTALRLRLEAIDPADEDATRSHLDAATAEVGRMARIVEGLLALVRAEGSRPPRVVIDVAEVLRERAAMWDDLAAERSVQLAVDAASSLAAYDVHGHLEQVLDNLLANALEVAPAGSTVEVGASSQLVEERPSVTVTVRDAGPGMSEAQRLAAFDRFWQGGATSGSAGLGLPISRQLARASGGDLTLEAAAGGGLRAVIRLDRAPSS